MVLLLRTVIKLRLNNQQHKYLEMITDIYTFSIVCIHETQV